MQYYRGEEMYIFYFYELSKKTSDEWYKSIFR